MGVRDLLRTTGAIGLSVLVCGCAGTQSATKLSAKAPSFARNFTPPATGCGSFKTPLPADPDGVLNQLSAQERSALGGYTTGVGATVKLLRSNWSNWKPKHGPPWTVGISWVGPVSDFQRLSLAALQASLKADPQVGKIITNVTSTVDVPLQLQQFNQMIAQRPDIVLLEPILAGAFLGPIDRAAKQGIPTVTLLAPTADPNVVSVDANTFLYSATMASYVSKLLGGKGTVLYAHGLTGSGPDVSGQAGWDAVIGSCPGMKVAPDAVYGQFLDAPAQSQTLQYLATHPQQISAVWEAGYMAAGVIRAFQRAGRPIPIVADTGMTNASLGYWRQHRSSYHSVASTLPPGAGGQAMVEVALRMLNGQGIKSNLIVGKGPLITDANLSDWVSPNSTLATPGSPAGPRSSFLPSSDLNGYFNHPAPVK